MILYRLLWSTMRPEEIVRHIGEWRSIQAGAVAVALRSGLAVAVCDHSVHGVDVADGPSTSPAAHATIGCGQRDRPSPPPPIKPGRRTTPAAPPALPATAPARTLLLPLSPTANVASAGEQCAGRLGRTATGARRRGAFGSAAQLRGRAQTASRRTTGPATSRLRSLAC